MNLVLVIAPVAFLFGMAGVAVFGPPEEERRPIGVVDWVVRMLVGLAAAHTCVGIYRALEASRGLRDLSDADRAVSFATDVESILAYGGILIGIAVLVHLLNARRTRDYDR
jgi:hypothetical protein